MAGSQQEGGCQPSFSLLSSCIPSSFSISHPSPRPAPAPAPPIAALPDDLLAEILARCPAASLPALSLVSARFRSILLSPAFPPLRGDVRESFLAIYVSTDLSDASSSLSCAKLRFNSGEDLKFDLSTFPFLSPSFSFSFSHAQSVSIGRWVYTIGRGATLRFDAWTGSVALRAPTLFPRKRFAAAALGGRIYVAGGSARSAAVEEYQPECDTWRVVGHAPFKRYGCVGASSNGLFHIAGGIKISNSQNTLSAHVCAGSIDSFHPASNSWVRTDRVHPARAVPGGGCIVALCSLKDSLFVLASHALELSFWRWVAGRWERLERPPVGGRDLGLGLGLGFRVGCGAVGEEKVVCVVSVRGRRGRGEGEVAVLVYDVPGARWTHGPGLGRGFSGASCVCVEC